MLHPALLNPFRGVAHTIRFALAEAVTTDGIEWDIYVANDALVEKHYQLYPAIIDRPALQAARGEAALLRSQPRKRFENEALSLDYIELNSTESG